MPLNPQARSLNRAIRSTNPAVYKLLSRRGRAIYFPRLGILSQSAEAAGKTINATIGTALEDSGASMTLESLVSLVNIPRAEGFSYAPSSGRPEIRSSWKRMMLEKNPSLQEKTFSMPLVTSALTHGLSMAGYLFIDERDAIISPDYYWENYDLIFKNAYGGRIDTFPTFIENRRFNVPSLRDKLLRAPAGKKAVILNFPNNPTGYTVTESEAEEVRAALVEAAEAGNHIAVFIDDSYFGLVYEQGVLRESMFALLADAHERILAIKFDGPTKEDYVWGFRIGFVTFGSKNGTAGLYHALESKCAGAIRGNISNASNISQSLLLRAFDGATYNAEKEEKYRTLAQRYRKIRKVIAAHPEYGEYFRPLPFNSGYFMCIRIFSGKAEAVRRTLLNKYSTGTIAQNDVLRLAFSSTPIAMIETLFENCYRAARECA
ncbi:MAG: aminotransferase class I/II-fold pyridoxal phosphate-dependent enzyme [Chitinispirillaceae bacterium]|nr:aminotransferase class I/II-fold pyridoxal phosphate-dependent enzyme [Chitinispirillaceae bacterium]